MPFYFLRKKILLVVLTSIYSLQFTHVSKYAYMYAIYREAYVFENKMLKVLSSIFLQPGFLKIVRYRVGTRKQVAT